MRRSLPDAWVPQKHGVQDHLSLPHLRCMAAAVTGLSAQPLVCYLMHESHRNCAFSSNGLLAACDLTSTERESTSSTVIGVPTVWTPNRQGGGVGASNTDCTCHTRRATMPAKRARQPIEHCVFYIAPVLRKARV